jgi:hypothetical protein
MAKAKDEITYEVECTDTFGGEANYTWVRREEIKVPKGASRRMLIGRAKRAVGRQAVPTRNSELGDGLRMDVVGAAIVIFVTCKEEP